MKHNNLDSNAVIGGSASTTELSRVSFRYSEGSWSFRVN